MVCSYCGKHGGIDVWGFHGGMRDRELFQYLGHNPLSGHMHFQCPACHIVLLVSPLAILGKGVIMADFRHEREARKPWKKILHLLGVQSAPPASRGLMVH